MNEARAVAFSELVLEDFYEHEFKEQFAKSQYRLYLRKKKESEIAQDMIYFEEEYYEIFSNEEHFKKWYINTINYNYNTKFTTYNEAKRCHKSEGWKMMKGENSSNPYELTIEEDKIFKEVLKAGFTKLSKKYHPDIHGDDEKMKLINSLKEKIK